MNRLFLLALLLSGLTAHARPADPGGAQKSDSSDRFNLHFQTTYIYQYKPSIRSPYQGANSLRGAKENVNSLTATLYAGARLWKSAAIFINPELAGGSGLSGALGMAGSSNGETFRVGDPAPTLYLARAFFVQTVGLRGGGYKRQDDDANFLQGYEPVDYVRFYIGKMSLGDLFDANAFSNSPRTQFMNWGLMNTGAWDYAANVRGYTYTAIAQLKLRGYQAKLAAATLPTTANGPDLNTDLGKSISVNGALEKNYFLRGREGNIRLLGYVNHTNMGSYRNALSSVDTPDITATRVFSRSKIGVCLSADQKLTDNLGVFLRAGYNDGRTETWAFTEIDRTIGAGAVLSGDAWNRKDDEAGAAVLVNGLSKPHRDYLAAGGLGFIVGDGALNYRPEQILELYYSLQTFRKEIVLTGDYQYVRNPAYNHDRGPVNIFSVRLHVSL